jgi:amidase
MTRPMPDLAFRTAGELVGAIRRREVGCRELLATPVAAIPHDQDPNWAGRTIRVNGQARPYEDQLVWAGVVGMACLPAIVAPVGRTTGGLPVGVQIVGPCLEDRTAIDFARRLADGGGGCEIPPGFEG